MTSLFALSFATALLGLSPGPAVFATIGRVLSQGLGSGYLFIIGILIGDLVFALLAMLGLATIATNYSGIFLALKIIGGGYLITLGIQNWKQTKAKTLENNIIEKGWKLTLSGFLLTASNPKDLLFFIGFLPAFVALETAGFIDIFVVSIVIVITFLCTLSVYALAANKMRQILKNETTFYRLNRLSGALLIAVGIIVIST